MNRTISQETPRGIALTLIGRVERRGAFADRVFNSPDVRKLDRRDSDFIREIVLGVLRTKLRLDRIIETYYNKSFASLDPDIVDIMRVGLYQMLLMDSVPDWAAVDESVKLASQNLGKGAGNLVNAILRRYTREGEPPLPGDFADRVSVETSHPLWLVRKWISVYGEGDTERICRAGNEKHPVFVRAQSIKISPDGLKDRLDGEGFESSAVTGMPGYLAVKSGEGLFRSAAFRDGLFTVQDPSAGMAGELLGPAKGESVLDLCAAPGGKATHCAELMGDCGCVTAVDVNPKRIGLIRETVERLGLDTVTCVRGDAETFAADSGKMYDSVLLDAPCSGTGVLSKRLDIRWRLSEADIARMAELQARMLDNAADQVAPGGALVYSTCSLEPEENGGIVSPFLDSRGDFTIERDNRFEAFETPYGYLILPHRMQGTGAFAVKMRRQRHE